MQHATTTLPETTLGLDIGDRFTHVCVLDATASVRERLRFPTTRSGLAKAFSDRPPCRVALEVGTHSPWMSRALEAMGHEVIVANAREVQSITRSTRKNDAADGEPLARLGRSDPKLLRPIRHRGEQVQRHRAWLAVRRKLVDTRMSLVAQARGLTKGLGERLPACKPDAFVRKVRGAPSLVGFPGLDTLLEVIEVLDAKLHALDQELQRLCRQTYPETQLLSQVPGVGPVTALSYLLTLEDPRHFATSRRVGSYLGLRPKQRDAGEHRSQLSISKEGDRELRRLLVQCAQWILARGPDSNLKRAALRRVHRGGAAAYKKAVVALARKLACVLHHLWLTGEVYEPLHRHGSQAA